MERRVEHGREKERKKMLSLALENAHFKIKHSSYAEEFVTLLSHLAAASL